MKKLLYRIYQNIYRYRGDIVLGIILGSVFFVATYQMGKTIPSIILDYSSFDRWYEGDIPRAYENMTWRGGDYSRINVHPLFPLATHPFVYMIKKFFGIAPVTAVRLIIGFLAFAWMFVLFLILRIIGCRRFDAVLLCLLAAVSAASVFWFTIPETISYGSFSILLALLIVPLSQGRVLSPVWYILVNILTFSFVVTNWMAGILATFATNKIKRALHIIVYSFVLVTVLWGIQKYIYSSTTFFIGEPIDAHNFTIVDRKSGGPVYVTASIFYHSLIMPAIQVVTDEFWDAPTMLTQLSAPGSGTLWGMIAVMIWFVLLSFGIWALFSMKEHRKLRIVVGLMLLGQLSLHIVYGAEAFLCSLHFIVLLILMPAFAALTRLRKTTVVLILLLIPCVTINNLTQFNKAKEFLRKHVKHDPNARHKCLYE